MVADDHDHDNYILLHSIYIIDMVVAAQALAELRLVSVFARIPPPTTAHHPPP